VSEGDPGNWAAVARTVSDRVRERGWHQRELAERPHVPVAVVREIQRHTVEHSRSRRTPEALPVALGWGPGHFDGALNDHARQTGRHAPANSAVWSRLDFSGRRLEITSGLLAELKSDLATAIDYVRDNRRTGLSPTFGPCGFHVL
jgi:hypothetical protein